MKNYHDRNCPWHGVDLDNDICMDEMGDTPCLCKNRIPTLRSQKTLSDDKQFQQTLAFDIRLRIANKSQDAWQEYIKKNKKNYPDYSMSELALAGVQWRQNYIIDKLCKQLARTTASLTDLLGVANDLRSLAKAETVEECSGIFKTLMDRPAFKKQAG